MTSQTNEDREQNVLEDAQIAAYRRLVKRLPLTLRPSLNQQLGQWKTLFPFERARLGGFLDSMESCSPEKLDALTRPIRDLERKMGVSGWGFSETEDTVENASLLARSEYYAEWRQQVQTLFDAADAESRAKAGTMPGPTRLVFLVLPETLPVEASTVWSHWGRRGREFAIEGDSRELCKLVMRGNADLPPLDQVLARGGSPDSTDLWLIDADNALTEMLPGPAHASVSSLSYTELKEYKDQFLAGINRIPRSLSVTDQIIGELRRQDWRGWCPPAIRDNPQLREFVLNLWLSGNGALIFSDAFVEWASSEALRRARPRAVVARFGVRPKPKVFTSIALFENQQKISTLPDEPDPMNSATDAEILACYIWLAASRYPESARTLCVCVAEHLHAGYVIAPGDRRPDWSMERKASPAAIYKWISEQMLA